MRKRYFFTALSLSLLLFVACNSILIDVQAIESKEAITPRNEGKTSVSKDPMPRDDGETQTGGEPAAAKVDPVKNFLGAEVIQILSKPDDVESFLVGPELAESTIPERSQLGGFPILKVGSTLKKEQLETFQSLVLDEKSYLWKSAKRCLFRPEIGLRFIKGEDVVEILLSNWCSLWSFVHQGKQKIEDYDPISAKLEDFCTSLFPNEPR